MFKLTANEFEIIMNIISDRNPKEQDQIMESYTIDKRGLFLIFSTALFLPNLLLSPPAKIIPDKFLVVIILFDYLYFL